MWVNSVIGLIVGLKLRAVLTPGGSRRARGAWGAFAVLQHPLNTSRFAFAAGLGSRKLL